MSGVSPLSSKVHNRQKFIIPKNSVHQIQFNGNNPNYYRVNNLGETTLYFATNNTPREDLYDFKCSPNSISNYAEPFQREFLYCYNPHNVDVEILITYWSGEFDPAFIAFGESTLNVEGTIKTDGVINSFNTSLPEGNNTIGKIELSEGAKAFISGLIGETDITTEYLDDNVSGALMMIAQNIDSWYMDGCMSNPMGNNIDTIIELLGDIKSLLGDIKNNTAN